MAIVALILNTWRLEQTEKNRNVRQAGFEILKNLGELQAVINQDIYANGQSKEPPLQGWNYIAMMGDIAVLMPLRSRMILINLLMYGELIGKISI